MPLKDNSGPIASCATTATGMTTTIETIEMTGHFGRFELV